AHHFSAATALALQPNGKIVVAGYTTDAQGLSDFAVARYNANGSLDTTFDADGIATTHFLRDARAAGVAVQADGKIVVVGATNDGARSYFAVARYTANGSLDATFGSGGKQTTSSGNNSLAAAGVAVQADGRIVVAG